MNALEVKNVSYVIDNMPIIDNVSFGILPGSMTGIIGPNGAGKTTLLNLITASTVPSAGKISLNNQNVFAMHRRDIARMVAVVPDSFETQFYLTVFDIVLMGRYAHGAQSYKTASMDIEITEAAMQKVGILSLRNQYYKTLSSGEKQKVLLARAIAQDSPVIILDEPTSNLDIKNQMEIMQILWQMHISGKTILAIMHDINLAVRFIKNFIFLKDGHLAHSGNIDAVFTKEILSDLYDIPIDVFADIHSDYLFMQAQKPE